MTILMALLGAITHVVKATGIITIEDRRHHHLQGQGIIMIGQILIMQVNLCIIGVKR